MANEIGKSIKTQKEIFRAYQPHLLRFLNINEGRELLWKRLGTKFLQPITEIGRNHIIEHLEGNKYRASFFSKQPFTNLLLPLIQKGELLRVKYNPYAKMDEAYAFYAGLKSGKLPRIYEEELLRGFNPLMYKQLYENPQIRFLESTFNPVAGANSPVDGYVERDVAPSAQTWSQVRDGAGTAGYPSVVVNRIWSNTGSSSPYWYQIQRTVMLFDTSSLTASAVISTAVLSIYGQNNYSGLGSVAVQMISCTPASDSNLVAGDYNTMGSTTFGNIAAGSFSTSAYNDVTLNASGISNISLTNISKFAAINDWDYTNTPPTWAADNTNRYSYAADNGTNIPKLVVTFTLGGGTISGTTRTLIGVGK